MPIYNICGLNTKIEPVYDRLINCLEKYKTDETDAQIDLTVKAEQYLSKMKELNPNMSDDIIEYLIYGAMFYSEFIDYNGFMVHSSAIVYKNKAYLFSAPSGTGKSTHTSLWIKYLGEDKVKLLNDDKPALQYKDNNVYVWGTPFSGKHNLNENECYPLGGICYLTRGTTNNIEKMSNREIIPKIIEQTMLTGSQNYIDKLFDILNVAIPKMNFYKLQCDMSEDAFKTSFEKLTGEKYTHGN